MTKKKKGQPTVEIIKYDRAELEHQEVQPITTEDGHTIYVDGWGRFGAKVGEVEVSEHTLADARDKVHRNHLAQQRKLRKKVLAVAAFIYDEGSENGWIGEGFFRGVHAGNGQLQWSRPDGSGREGGESKFYGDKVYVWSRDHQDVPVVTELVERIERLDEELKKAQKKLRPLLRAQKERMFAERPGWKSAHEHGPTVRNNAEKANEKADMIVANVLKPDDS